jgi:hypothetical protein
MRLRVKHKGHTHGGQWFAVGEEFDGSARLLAAMPDRFEAVLSEPMAQEATAEEQPKPKRGRPRKVGHDANATDSK